MNEQRLLQVAVARPRDERSLLALLPEVERERIVRLHRSADRDASATAHVLARAMLAAVLTSLTRVHLRPALAVPRTRTLDPVVALASRPALVGLDGHQTVDVNLTHTTDLVAVAVLVGGRVGIDVERIGAMKSVSEIAFAASENRWLATVPNAHRELARVRLWTAKEAVLKCTGHGLFVSPDDLAFDRSGRLVAAPAEVYEGLATRDPSVRSRRVGPGHVLTVAVGGHGRPPTRIDRDGNALLDRYIGAG